MKALVTGCAGFIGSNLTERLLRDGFDVIGIDCFTDYYARAYKEKNIEKSLENERFTLLEQDLRSMENFPAVDYVFHQAAQAGVRKSWGSDFEIQSPRTVSQNWQPKTCATCTIKITGCQPCR